LVSEFREIEGERQRGEREREVLLTIKKLLKVVKHKGGGGVVRNIFVFNPQGYPGGHRRVYSTQKQ
jgi:hypothetical protein